MEGAVPKNSPVDAVVRMLRPTVACDSGHCFDKVAEFAFGTGIASALPDSIAKTMSVFRSILVLEIRVVLERLCLRSVINP